MINIVLTNCKVPFFLWKNGIHTILPDHVYEKYTIYFKVCSVSEKKYKIDDCQKESMTQKYEILEAGKEN